MTIALNKYEYPTLHDVKQRFPLWPTEFITEIEDAWLLFTGEADVERHAMQRVEYRKRYSLDP